MPNRPARSSKTSKFLFCFFLIGLAATCLAAGAHAGVEYQDAVVDKALTGDSVLLQGGKTLKYASILANPLQSKIALVREYGEQALAFNQSLVGGQKIRIEWDSKLRDEQNRLLGFVYLTDGRFVNQEIVLAGHAKVRVKAPNIKHAVELRKAENQAKKDRLGQWLEEPKDPYGDTLFIGDKVRKIFYLPTSPELERIPEAQWVHFRSRIEARAAGYRVCDTCRENSADEAES